MDTILDKLKAEDYEEPACLLCNATGNEKPEAHIETVRIQERLDHYLEKEDYAGAEKHLLYWLQEAEIIRDKRGELFLRNELMGIYRKTSCKANALDSAKEALLLLNELEMEETVTAATVYINAATVMKAFEKADEALPYFEKAQKIYESSLNETDPRLGGLYNNYALALADTGRFAEARKLYGKALDVTAQTKNGETEQAITWLNLADLTEKELGAEEAETEINECLDRAETLLDTDSLPQDSYYAFVCDKCAPSFGYYGRFFYEKELIERSRKIHERS